MTPTIDRFAGEYAFLSNFYPSPIIGRGGLVYPSVEHAFQAAKTVDPEVHRHIAATPSASEAKRIGRAVQLRSGWDESVKYNVMAILLGIKFYPHSELANRLSTTGLAILIEGNTWHDQIWGDCRCGRSLCLAQGHNLLGKALMHQRNYLRSNSNDQK